VLTWGGRFIINIQPFFSEYVPIHHIISSHLMKRHLIWKGEVVWEKNNYNCKYTSWGSWKSPASPYLKYTWEFIEIFCKGEMKKTGTKDCIDITAEEFKSWVVAKWSMSSERNMKAYDHPAMFPEELVLRCLKLFSYVNDTVLDPFNGVGTTTYVAKPLNRNSRDIFLPHAKHLNINTLTIMWIHRTILKT
jgi:DNA modification methylase